MRQIAQKQGFGQINRPNRSEITMKRPLLFLLVFGAIQLLLLCLTINADAQELPKSWKYQGKTMPMLLEHQYSNTKGPSYLRWFMRGIADYEDILLEKQRGLREKGIPLEKLPYEATQMYNELVDLTNKGVIGIRVAIFADIVVPIEIKPEQLLVTFANGKSCPAVGLVYFDEDQTDTQLGKALLIKKLARQKPLQVVIYVPRSFRKLHSNYPSEKWVTKITLLPAEPQTALAEKGR